MFKFLKQTLFILLLVALVTACTGNQPIENIYKHLEEAVSLEAGFEEQQEPLAKTENEEYELYENILNKSELEEIIQLANEAKELASSRREMLENEKSSIEEAYVEFQNIIPIVNEIEDEAILNVAKELVQAMESRYSAYIDLHNEYKEAIELDIALYDLIQKENLTIDQLQQQHDLVNESYQKVNELKDSFNEFTVKYNELKRQLYKEAELEVVYN